MGGSIDMTLCTSSRIRRQPNGRALARWLLGLVAVGLPACGKDDGTGGNNQGNSNSVFNCGDGVLAQYPEYSEDCDGSNLQGQTCESLGFEGGALGCKGDCTFDVSLCLGHSCGNGVANLHEVCDGTDLKFYTCDMVGGGYSNGERFFIGGSLACTIRCSLNTEGCIVNSRCGDGFRENPEGCDDGPLNSDIQPDACRTDCRHAHCGDGVIDTTEACDDGIWNSDQVPDACRPGCRLPGCGDGVADTGEECDDGPYNSALRPDACRPGCLAASCGDGVTDTAEDCDGSDLGGLDCTDHGYPGGTLGCLPDCTFDLTACQ